MKKIPTAILFGLLMTAFIGCSSVPEGTVAIKDLQKNIEQQIGQKVVVVGSVDTGVPGMSAVRLFRLYKGNDAVWVYIPEGEIAPPQGVRVRVSGVISKKDFSAGVGERVYIEADTPSGIRME